MQEIESIVRDFIDAEYNAYKAKYDVTISDEEYRNYEEKAESFISPPLSSRFDRGDIESIKGDEELAPFYKIKVAKMKPRILFKIEKYTNPILGDGLKRFVLDNEIFACYMNDAEVVNPSSRYSHKFFIANTQSGLKIVYYMIFNKKNKWEHISELDTTIVINPGELAQVEKFRDPDDAPSLEDCNKK